MSRLSKGIAALREVPKSASDAVAEAISAIRQEPGFPTGGARNAEEAYAAAHLDGTAEQSKPGDQEPFQAPSLYVPGMQAIREAGAATEAERVREYGLLAEIEAKIGQVGDDLAKLSAVISATEATLEKARAEEIAKLDVRNEFLAQRAETVDRIVKLNQAAIDHETARLRRGS